MLIAFGGLPGTGKTTLARTVAARYAAIYLRIDTIEQAIRSSDVLRKDIGAAGYITAYRIAADNLRVGRSVVGDAVNPLKVTRDSWAEIARLAGAPLIEVEVRCSDLEEHRARVESRRSDIEGLSPPSWQDVLGIRYEPWSGPHIIVDTARKTIVETQDELMQELAVALQLNPGLFRP
jgi:predicted kinase